MTEITENKEYKQGYKAKKSNERKEDCPYRNDKQKRHLWLSGWHDADMEKGGARWLKSEYTDV